MIFDQQNLLSFNQAITADAASTNVIDLGPIGSGIVRDIGRGAKIPLRIQVTETFNNLTSMLFIFQVDDNEAFSSPKVIWTSPAVLLAQLVAGYVQTPEDILRGTDERYARLFYDITGTAPTLGRITAGVVAGAQSNG